VERNRPRELRRLDAKLYAVPIDAVECVMQKLHVVEVVAATTSGLLFVREVHVVVLALRGHDVLLDRSWASPGRASFSCTARVSRRMSCRSHCASMSATSVPWWARAIPQSPPPAPEDLALAP